MQLSRQLKPRLHLLPLQARHALLKSNYSCEIPLSAAALTLYSSSILTACIGTIQGQVNACASTDYSCLCTQYINLLTCYNNCPADPGVSTVQQQREQYCNAASVYASTSTHASVAATSAASSATTTDASNTAAQSGFASSTNTGASSSATTKNAAPAALPIIGGGMIGFAAAFIGYIM